MPDAPPGTERWGILYWDAKMPYRELLRKCQPEVLEQALVLFYRFTDAAQRITETVDLREDAIRRSVTLDIIVPDPRGTDGTVNGPDMCLLPVLRAVRGRLFDNLDVVDRHGDSLSILAQDENKYLASLLIQTELARSTRNAPYDLQDREYYDDVRDLLSLVPFLEPDAATDFCKAARDSNLLTRLEKSDAQRFAQLFRLVDFLAARFLTTVEVRARPLDRILIKYSYDSAYVERAKLREPVRTLPEEDSAEVENSTLRRLLGQRPYSFRFAVPLAFVAPSYHFRMNGPPGSYCHCQSLVRFAGADGAYQAVEWMRPPEIQYRRSERGASYAHIYLHGLEKREHFALAAEIVFYERLPGSIGSVTMVSSITTAFLLVMAGFAHFFIERSAATSLGVAALILALPGTAAFWLQPSLDRGDFATGPLASRIGLLGTGVVAFLGVLVVVLGGLLAPLKGVGGWVFQGALGGLGLGSAAITWRLGVRLAHSYKVAPK